MDERVAFLAKADAIAAMTKGKQTDSVTLLREMRGTETLWDRIMRAFRGVKAMRGGLQRQ